MTELADDASATPEADPKMYGVVVGRVINVLDPLMLGRVQVQIPAIDALDLSPWARVATPGASLASGIYWIPNSEDEVWWPSSTATSTRPTSSAACGARSWSPPLPSPVPQIRLIRSPLGNQIMFMEAPPSIIITTADMLHSIIMSPAGIQIVRGPTSST